jgi:hypothetical protein
MEDDHVSDPFGIESELPTEMPFPRKAPSSQRTRMNFEVLVSVNLQIVALPGKDREHKKLV